MNKSTLLCVCCAGLIYLVYCCTTQKPERTIYGFTCIWLFCPKSIQQLPLLGPLNWEGHAMFEFVEAFLAAGVAGALLAGRAKRAESWPPRTLKRFAMVFLATVVSAAVLSVWLPGVWSSYPGFDIRLRERVLPVLSTVYGVIFVTGCAAFIRRLESIEKLFLFLVIAGAELAVEALVFFHMHALPDLSSWALDRWGRFISLTMESADLVGLICIMSVCCSAYFCLTRKRVFWLGLTLLPFVAIAGLAAKTPLSGALAGLAIMVWLTTSSSWRPILMLSIAAVGVVLAGGVVAETAVVAASRTFGGTVREDYFGSGSFYGRLGLYSRAIDVVIAEFPFGSGPGMASYHMGSYIPQIFPVYDHPVSQAAYDSQQERGIGATATHNVYLELIVEYGPLGAIVLGWFVRMILHNYRVWRFRAADGAFSVRSRLNVAQACVYATLLGLGVRYATEAGNKLYFLLFMFLYFTFLLVSLDESVRARRIVWRAAKGRSSEYSFDPGPRQAVALGELLQPPRMRREA